MQTSKARIYDKILATLALSLMLGFTLMHFVPFASAQSAAQPSASTQLQNNVQYPNYSASIKVPENASDENLTAMVKITPDQAKSAALSNPTVSGGNVTGISLDNENGNLVYSVQITKGTAVYDVKVDAGNGHVLFIDTGMDSEVSAVESIAE